MSYPEDAFKRNVKHWLLSDLRSETLKKVSQLLTKEIHTETDQLKTRGSNKVD